MKIGTMVLVHGVERQNGNVQPAIVTRVLKDGLSDGVHGSIVNCSIFPDCSPMICVTDITVYASEAEATEFEAILTHANPDRPKTLYAYLAYHQ